ncbi:hypothetical protein CNBH3760 [Cryptococcus deneoformans B-3501A]|uniref:hypothetical protein n=1 Tax=Cryptococcus deneoformans (strain B-3501A) TaxID=283643 RepID=UPI000042F07B|nr:hypothetical protein CNBH3760 [Cryptococcus neoformans var. neoformans B-3501A]EAL19277.1 hypothetical protein CNBH3760 [Cryptococcus neoformans var. neoformans B-3501A]
MPICPVCDSSIDADQAAFEHHVNNHFVESAGTSSIGKETSKEGSMKRGREESLVAPELDICPACDFPLSFLTPIESQTHLATCLSGQEIEDDVEFDYSSIDITAQQQRDNDVIDKEWDGPARPGKWTGWVGRKVEKGDRWWDPLNGSTVPSELPSNFSPGVIIILAAALRTSAHQGKTRRAVLCRDTAHIKGVWKFDLGWGCGYRNALMSLTSLLSVPSYAPLFSKSINGAEPGVRRVQGWIEEAWEEGYDPEGKQQLGGTVLGRRKWIGPSDLYAMFTYKGIPCIIYDFPKPPSAKDDSKAAYARLQQWVKDYFNESTESPSNGSAFDVLMRSGENGSGRGEVVRVSIKFPLILQHSGHSRTIVGYEENARGDVNLLLFDPGKTMPKDIRNAALTHLAKSRAQALPLINTSLSTSGNDNAGNDERSRRPGGLRKKSSSQSQLEKTHESVPFSPPFTNGRAEVIYDVDRDKNTSGVESQTVEHLRGGAQDGSDQGGKSPSTAIPIEDDEEITPSGWVRKKRALKSKISSPSSTSRTLIDPTSPTQAIKTLNHFRVNLGNLSKHTQYQILMFTGGPVLSDSEKERRKIVSSTVIR